MPVNYNDIVPDHKLIVPAVGMAASVGDIEQTLSEPSGDLGTLCQSTHINRWAKYKPVKRANALNFDSQMNSNGTWKDSATWWQGDDGKCGINVSYQTNMLSMCRTWLSQGWEAFWQYVPPIGTSSSPFRFSDFNYYLHRNQMNPDYDKPYHSWSFGGLATETESISYVFVNDNTGEYDESSYTLAQGAVYRNTHNNQYLLKLSDFIIKNAAATTTMGDTYFGVIVAYDINGSQPKLSLNTCPFTWNTNVPSNHEWHPAGTDLRFTPQLRFAAFNQYNMDYYAFPVCVKTDNSNGYSNWQHNMCKMTSADDSSKTVFDGNTRYIIPLPLEPKILHLKPQNLIFKISISVVATEYEDVLWNITVTNVSSSAFDFQWSLLKCDHISYPKTANGETDYSDVLEQPSLTVSSNTTSYTVQSGGTLTLSNFHTSPRQRRYGYYDSIKIYSNFGYIDKAFASVDYS